MGDTKIKSCGFSVVLGFFHGCVAPVAYSPTCSSERNEVHASSTHEVSVPQLKAHSEQSLTTPNKICTPPPRPIADFETEAGGVYGGPSVPLEFRYPTVVSFTNQSTVFGATTCVWRLDGTVISNDCDWIGTSFPTGERTIQLKVTDSNSLSDSVSALLQVSAPCAGVPDTLVTLRAAISSERVSRTSSVLAPCGQTSTPGANPGIPFSFDPEPICEWVWARYFVVYTDGTWEWLTDWGRECEWATLRAVPAVTESGSTSAMRVQLVGSGRLENGRKLMLSRDSSSVRDVSISIDTTRANIFDFARALSAAEKLIGKERPKNKEVLGQLIAEEPERPMSTSSRFYRQAASAYNELLKATKVADKQGRLRRTVEVNIDRNDPVSSTARPNN